MDSGDSARDTLKPKLRALCEEVGGQALAPLPAAQNADLVVLSLPWRAAEDVVWSLGGMSGKIVLDAMKPIVPRTALFSLIGDTIGR
ncbi:MAG: hypothetical protein GC182_05235 [Rhodopseudomonas sp.]|nr:hypothetical protein [Rhodopseudomonas sp.]